MNLNLTDYFKRRCFLFKIVEGLHLKREIKMKILQFILEHGDWNQYEEQLQSGFNCFILYSLLWDDKSNLYFSKKALILLLRYCSESIVQKGFEYMMLIFNEHSATQNDPLKNKMCKVFFQHGFLVDDKNNELFYAIRDQEEISTFFSLFV